MVIFIICCALAFTVSFCSVMCDEGQAFLAAKNLFVRRISRASLVMFLILGNFSRLPIQIYPENALVLWGFNWIALIFASVLASALSLAISWIFAKN